MKYFNTLHPFGLNTDVFNKSVKTFSTLNIKNNKIENHNDFAPIYLNLNFMKKLLGLKENLQIKNPLQFLTIPNNFTIKKFKKTSK